MEVCKFQKKHIKEIDISKKEEAEMLVYYYLHLKSPISPAFTVKVAGMVQGMAGIRLISRYIGEAWVCFNHEFLSHHKKSIIVKIRDYMDFIGIIFNLKRIQAIIDVESDTDKRFIQFLGFRYMKKFKKGFDVYSMNVKGV